MKLHTKAEYKEKQESKKGGKDDGINAALIVEALKEHYPASCSLVARRITSFCLPPGCRPSVPMPGSTL